VTSKFALVIANTEYQDASFAKLTAPGKDAEEFAQVLRELAVFDNVQILLNEGEGKTRRSIARFFAERKRDDLLLLYFSGHGIRNGQGQLFLAASDTEINILEATGIPAEFVTYAMNNSRSQRQLLILDCCNSGAFAHGSKSASGVGRSMGIASAFEGSGFGRVVLTATDATQYAWEGDKVIGDTQKSVFTHFLIEGLKGDADRNSDGRIDVDELYDYAYEQVVRRTPKQTPGKWSYKQQGDILLRENLKPRDVKPAPLPSELLEMLSHPNSGVRRAGIQELISLLDGKHLGLARAAEEKLREIATSDDSFSLRKTASETLIAHGLAFEEPTPPPVITPPIVPVEIPVLEEKSELEKLASQAIQYELRGDFWNALQTYYKIKRIDPLYPRVDIKIKELEGELRPKPVTNVSVIKSSEVSVGKQVKPLRLIGLVAGGLLIVGFLIWGASKFLQSLVSATTQPTVDVSLIETDANGTAQAKWTEEAITTATMHPLSTPSLGPTMIGNDGMTLLYVQAGEFTMGSDTSDSYERPEHQVFLDSFWIDQTEVTNEKYAKCVTENQCDPPNDTDHYSNLNYANHPVAYVSWNDALAYCSWADRRLPTEAEWEKAARGKDGRAYPWGDGAPNNELLNYNGAVGDTAEVGSYPNGASPYGALDMAGNIGEWVADWYSEAYYASSPQSNPSGPNSGQYRVFRGGMWNGDVNFLRSSDRSADTPDRALDAFGFRCAMNATPTASVTPVTTASIREPETPAFPSACMPTGNSDTVEVLSINPPIGTSLKIGQTYTFTVRVKYQLQTRNDALLELSIYSFRDVPQSTGRAGENSVRVSKGCEFREITLTNKIRDNNQTEMKLSIVLRVDNYTLLTNWDFNSMGGFPTSK